MYKKRDHEATRADVEKLIRHSASAHSNIRLLREVSDGRVKEQADVVLRALEKLIVAAKDEQRRLAHD